MAPDRANESPKDALERRQAEEVKAWIEWDNKQTAAQAQIKALDAQIVGPGAPSTLTPAQNAAREVNDAKVKDAIAKKAAIEYAWEHELKCPIARLFADIDKAVKKEQVDRLVDATNRPPEGAHTREQVRDLKAETLLTSAQALIDRALLPQDLRSGENQKTAAGLVRPDLAAELPSADAVAQLSEYADQIQPVYDRLALYAEAAKDMEKGVAVGKAGETFKEAISNPGRLGWGVGSLIGLGLMYKAFGDYTPDAGLKKWVMGLLGVSAFLGGGYMAAKGVDVFNTATGIRTDALLSSDAMKTVRAELEARMGTKESGVIDDMMRVFDSPVGKYAEAYLLSVRSHSNGMEKERLAGNGGLSGDEMDFANNKFLKQGGDWLFMKCYDMALKDGKTTALTDNDAKRAAGAQYAKTEFAGLKVGSILVAIDMVEAGVGLPQAISETRVTDPHLRELESKDPAFAQVLEATDKPDVYLINGYPVRYNYTDTGDHVFTDLIGSVSFVKVDQNLTGLGLSSTLLRISTDAEVAARTVYTAAAIGMPSTSKLKYNNKGDWILDPGLDRTAHKGITVDPSDAKVPVILYYDTSDKTVKIGMDADGDGAPEVRATPYADVSKVAEEYEKNTVLKALVVADTNHVLLSVAPTAKITTITESTSPAQTAIEFQYGSGRVGKVVYENNAVKTITIDTAPDAGLETAWTALAKTKVDGFFKERVVQEELLKATGAYTPSTFTGYMKTLGELFSDGYQWIKDDSIANRFHTEQEKQIIREIQAMLDPYTGMEVDYVNSMFKPAATAGAAWTGGEFDKGTFTTAEKAFFTNQLTTIKGGMTRTVVPLVEADIALEGTELGDMLGDARDALEVALDPLHYEKSSASGAMSWRLVNGVWNFVTQDTGRGKLFNARVDAYMRDLATACNPVPPAAALGRKGVKDQIEIAVRKAQLEATGYWGLSDADATRKLMLVPLGPSPDPEWKKTTEMVADYLANHFKWESYGVFPNPENMAAVMSVWYEKMGDPKIAPANAADAKAFGDYFLWDVWVTFGGNKDYSMDKLYGGAGIDTVSDSDFRDGVSGFKTNLDTYASWTHRPANNKLRPRVPGMETSFEKYRDEVAKKYMEDWFATQNDIKIWSRFYRYGPDMFKWKEVYERSFARRLIEILNRSTDENILHANLEVYKKFISIEQQMVYEPLIMAGMVPESGRLGLSMPWSVFVETEINKDYTKYFNAVPPDFDGYREYIKKNMGDALDVFYHRPNVPGFPFWG